jgi:hypothetical protein
MIEKKKKETISINLNCYVISFREKKKKDNFVSLDLVFGNKTFKQIVQDLITDVDTASCFVNVDKTRVFYIDSTISLTDTSFSAIIKKGHSGHETYIDELNGLKVNTTSTITKDKFNSSPFYLLLSKPEKNNYKLLLFAQSYKQFGYKEIFEEAFKKFIKDRFSQDFICEISTLSVASLFERYIRDGNIRKLRFKKNILPKNFENVLGDNDIKDNNLYEAELSIKAKKQGFLGIKKNIKFNDSNFTEIFQFDNFDYDEAYADISIGNRKRTLNISRPSSFSASFDVTEKSCINVLTNHPDFSKLNEEAISILKDEIMPTFK